MTVNCGYNYEPPTQTIIDELNKILQDIYPHQYLIQNLSLSLFSGNPLEQFYIWIGSGGNGKGLLRDLLANTLGSYFDPMEIEYLCKTNHQGHATAADPVMARKKNSRLCITTEPEGDIKLKEAKLKQLSGNDHVQVRELFGKSFNYVHKFKLIIQTNYAPQVDGFDKALKRRLRYINFPNQFVDKPTLPNEKQIDRNLKEKIKSDVYKINFFHILLSEFLKFNGKFELNEPEQVINETKEFMNDNDPVQNFVDNNLVITNNIKDKIKSSELYENFINHNPKRQITPSMFKMALTNKNIIYKKMNNGSYYCCIQYINE